VTQAFEIVERLRLENGAKWGDTATTVQRADAAAVLDPDTRKRFFWHGRSRGWSKTTDAAAVAVGALVAQPAGSRSYCAAADQQQARLLIDAAEGLIRRTPPLDDVLDVGAWKITNRRTGATLEALAADAASSWGLLPQLVVVDELGVWGSTGGPRRLWESLSSAVAKTGGKLVVLTTASSPGHWSKRIRDHAEADPLWRLSEVHGPAPWLPVEMVEEQERRLLPSTFRRLFYNEWTSAEDSLVSDADLAAAVRLSGPLPPQPGRSYVVAVDLGLKKDRTVCVVCHGEPLMTQIDSLGAEAITATRVTLDRIEVWQGSRERPVSLAEVEEWIAQASQTYNGAQVLVDPWQAIGILQRLQMRGVVCEEFTFSATSVGRLAATLHGLLRDRLLLLPDDEALLDELRNVRLEERAPGVVRLAHDSDGHDDRAVALGMAAHRLVEEPVVEQLGAAFVPDVRPSWALHENDLERLRQTATDDDGRLSPTMRL
jgi:hypothetical protein